MKERLFSYYPMMGLGVNKKIFYVSMKDISANAWEQRVKLDRQTVC